MSDFWFFDNSVQFLNLNVRVLFLIFNSSVQISIFFFESDFLTLDTSVWYLILDISFRF